MQIHSSQNEYCHSFTIFWRINMLRRFWYVSLNWHEVQKELRLGYVVLVCRAMFIIFFLLLFLTVDFSPVSLVLFVKCTLWRQLFSKQWICKVGKRTEFTKDMFKPETKTATELICHFSFHFTLDSDCFLVQYQRFLNT